MKLPERLMSLLNHIQHLKKCNNNYLKFKKQLKNYKGTEYFRILLSQNVLVQYTWQQNIQRHPGKLIP
jgi:hypothetical protein